MDILKFKLTIAYDGSNYQGWQVQKIGTGVQEKVEESLAKLFPSQPRLHSSSRTDTGVHAMGMVAHLRFLLGNAQCRPGNWFWHSMPGCQRTFGFYKPCALLQSFMRALA